MDAMTILHNAVAARFYPNQQHFIRSVDYSDFDHTSRGRIEVEWVEKVTGQSSTFFYDDDVANTISRAIGTIEQRQMNYFIEPVKAKVWLK